MRAAVAVGLFTLALASFGAHAAPKKTGDRVTVTGCPTPGGAATCLMLSDLDGTVYNISSVSPWPRLIHRMVWLRGTVSARPSLCGGVMLERIRWTRLRQICPN